MQYRERNHQFESNQYTIEIDIIDGCNARCICCPRGLRVFPNTMKIMDFDLYKKIIDKAVTLNRKVVSLFSWGEPFLVRSLSKYCKYAYDNGMFVCLSSNLAMKINDIEEILKYTGHLYISVSGFSQEIYEITHRNCKIDIVKENVKKIDQLLKDGKINTEVEFRFFEYNYNRHEFEMWKEYLNDTKICLLMVDGNSTPRINIDLLKKGKEPTEWFGKVRWHGEPYYDKIPNVYCGMLRKFTIDVNGNMVLCCEKAFDDKLIIGNFLDDDIYEMQERKLRSKQCDYCEVKDDFLNILRKSDKDLIKQHKWI